MKKVILYYKLTPVSDPMMAVRWQREADEGGWRAWVPWPHVIAEDLTLGNPEWSKAPQMASLKKVELRLSPLALLTRWQPLIGPISSRPAIGLASG